jgi:hypothetical protein
METGDCYEVRDPKRGLVFRGNTRTLRGESSEEFIYIYIYISELSLKKRLIRRRKKYKKIIKPNH